MPEHKRIILQAFLQGEIQAKAQLAGERLIAAAEADESGQAEEQIRAGLGYIEQIGGIQRLINLIDEKLAEIQNSVEARNVKLPDESELELWIIHGETPIEEAEETAELIQITEGIGAGLELTPERYQTNLSDLFVNRDNLDAKAMYALFRQGLRTVGQVLEKSKEELVGRHRFGERSFTRLTAKLQEQGFLPQPQEPTN